MTFDFEELLQNYVNADFDTLASIAKDCIDELYPVFEQSCDSKDAPALLILGTIATCIASDGKFTELEYEFLAEISGKYNYQDLKNFVSEFRSLKSVNATKRIIDSLDGEDKQRLLTVCLCVCAVDETIKREETELLDLLFNN